MLKYFRRIFFIAYMALSVITIDSIAAAHARGDRAAVGRAFVQSAVAAAALGVACSIVIIVWPETVLGWFQTNAEIMPHAKPYAVIRAVSTAFALVGVICQSAFRATLDLRTPLAIVAGAAATNVVLDAALVLGCGYGAAGAALGTSVAQIGACFALCAIVWRRRRTFGIVEALAAAVRCSHATSALLLGCAATRRLCDARDDSDAYERSRCS